MRRRGRDVVVTDFARRRQPALLELRCDLDVPYPRLGAVIEALAGAAGEAAETIAGDIGVVGIVDGEEPQLTTLRPRQGDVAERFVRNLLAGEMHRHTHLWLVLTPGAYLAEAVDPFRPFGLVAGELPKPLRQKSVRAGLLVTRHDGTASSRLELVLYAPLSELRRVLAVSRPWLAAIIDRRAASHEAPRPPSTTENSTLQR